MEQDLASTGIEGLDDVLRGGFVRNRMYLVQGHPGCGKTTLGLQFLLAGAANGERGLYITLSESRNEITAIAASHGWSLEPLVICELKPHNSAIPTAGEYTMYHPSEVELHDSVQMLLDEFVRVKPTRVVIDSLSEIRLLAQQPLRYRRQLLTLKHFFADKAATVLLLDDEAKDPGTNLQTLAHGVVSLERHSPVYGGTRRRLEVGKLRGVQHRSGYHDFSIEPGGLRVYPRLIASEHRPVVDRAMLASGVGQLDALVGGGLDRGSATLILGPAGSGKSALCAQYAVAAALLGERSIIYSFDENITILLARAQGIGLDLAPHIAAGLIRVQQIDPAEMSPGQFAFEVRREVESGSKMVIIDSLTGYLNSMPEEHFLLNQMHELLSYLAQQGVVTLLVSTQHGIIGTNMSVPIDVSYLADTVLLLRYFEAGGQVRNAISVVKKRGGRHERSIREFALGATGVQIGEQLHDFHGILSGIPTYLGSEDSLVGAK